MTTKFAVRPSKQSHSTTPSAELVWKDPERMSGALCFAGTRVPVKNLWDYLEGGESLDDFLQGFQGVSREQALGVLHLGYDSLVEGLPSQ